MKRSLLLLPALLLLAACGRSYTLIGRVVFVSDSASRITEVKDLSTPYIGTSIPGTKVTVFYDLDGTKPVRNSTWVASVDVDNTGNFQINDYAAPGVENLVGLEVTAPGYETAYTTYVDYADPDAQYFVVVLRKKA